MKDARIRQSAGSRVAVLTWVGVLVCAAAALALAGYTSRDPDSTVYSEISARMATLPLASWIAPDWGGSWNFTGPFREHPVGIFVLPALLARLGYPGLQAAFAVGAVCSAAAIVLARRVAAPLALEHEAIAVQWALMILPIAFTYRVRANQEYPVLVLTFAGLYAVHRSRRSSAWIAGVIAAACGLALVKGIFVIFFPIVGALWLLCIRPVAPWKASDDVKAWVGLVLAVVSVVALAAIYEAVYRRTTGDSFLAFYLKERIGENAGIVGASGGGRDFTIGTKLYNMVWYLGRVAWFAMPGSIVLLVSARMLAHRPFDRLQGVWFAVAAGAAYVAAMSLGANKADRFIFPAYFFVGAAGAVVAMRRWPSADRFARRLAALPGYALPIAWLVLFMLTLASEHRLPYVKVWSS